MGSALVICKKFKFPDLVTILLKKIAHIFKLRAQLFFRAE